MLDSLVSGSHLLREICRVRAVSVYLRLTPALLDVLACLVSTGEAVWGLRVSTQSGRPTGTVYPILERLERSGFLNSRWDADETRPGPRRRLYELTREGRAWAMQQLQRKGHPAAATMGEN